MNALTPGYTPYALLCISMAGAVHLHDHRVLRYGHRHQRHPGQITLGSGRRATSNDTADRRGATDCFYGILNLSPQNPYLSNDSNEDLATSFVASSAADIRDTFVENLDDGTTGFDYRLTYPVTLRLPLTASEFLAGDFVPFDGTLSDTDIDDLLWPTIPTGGGGQATTSPAGDLSVKTSQMQLTIVDAATGGNVYA
jgi:hypothetical protein